MTDSERKRALDWIGKHKGKTAYMIDKQGRKLPFTVPAKLSTRDTDVTIRDNILKWVDGGGKVELTTGEAMPVPAVSNTGVKPAVTPPPDTTKSIDNTIIGSAAKRLAEIKAREALERETREKASVSTSAPATGTSTADPQSDPARPQVDSGSVLTEPVAARSSLTQKTPLIAIGATIALAVVGTVMYFIGRRA